MADCRIFFLGPDEHFTGVEVVSCESDIEAMAIAGTLEHRGSGLEVWQNARMIGGIKASALLQFLDMAEAG
jgi:hypothetical protein